MKNKVGGEAGFTTVKSMAVSPIVGILTFGPSGHSYVQHSLSWTGHFIFLLLTTISGQWLAPIIWICIAELVVLILVSPFLIWPEVRPDVIKAWTIGVLALLCARFILIFAGAP